MSKHSVCFTPFVVLVSWWIFLQFDVCEGGVVITKPGSSEADCVRACTHTTDIDCHFYKYSKSRGVCYLTAAPDPAVKGMKMIEKPAPAPNKKPASSWVSQLQARVVALEEKDFSIKRLHKEIAEMRAEIASLKNSRALTHHLLRTTKEEEDKNVEAVDEKTEVLKAEEKRVEDAVMTLGDLQKTFAEKVRKINEAQKATGLTMAMLSQTSKDMRSSIRELAASMSNVKTELSNVHKMMTQLEVRFAGLSTDVMERASSFDAMMGPELKDVKESQTTLAEALSMLTKKIMALSPRIPYMQKLLGSNQGQVNVVINKMKDLRREMGFMDDRIAYSEHNIKKFVDPASPINMKRRQFLTHLRSTVAMLANQQEQTKQDMMGEIADRDRLYKEMSSLKVRGQSMIQKVVSLEEDIRHFRRNLRTLAVEGPHAKVVEHILARQVAAMKSLRSLRESQADVGKALETFRWKIIKNRKKILGHQEQREMDVRALMDLKSRLQTIDDKLANQPPISVTLRQLAAMRAHQIFTLRKMRQMQRDQSGLQHDVNVYKSNIDMMEDRLEAEKTRRKKMVRLLERMRNKANTLYQAVWDQLKMLNHNHELSESRRKFAIRKLSELSSTQSVIMASLRKYRKALAKTQRALEEQQDHQALALHSTDFLHGELRKLRMKLNQMQDQDQPPRVEESTVVAVPNWVSEPS